MTIEDIKAERVKLDRHVEAVQNQIQNLTNALHQYLGAIQILDVIESTYYKERVNTPDEEHKGE